MTTLPDALHSYSLVIENGPEAFRSFLIAPGRPFIIGRSSEADLRLPDEDQKASRRHAQLEVVEGGVRVRDLQSSNGTWRDGQRVEETVLHAGDRLQVGRTILLLREGRDAVRDTVIQPPENLVVEIDYADDPLLRSSDDSIFPSGSLPALDVIWACDGCTAPCPDPAPGDFLEAGWLCDVCAHARTTRALEDPPSIASYEVLGAVGRGAMGAVYEARHRASGAHVAIKVLLPAGALDRVLVRRFLKEQRLAVSLVHPRVVRTYEVGQDEEHHVLYLVNEWVPRGDAATLGRTGVEIEVALRLGADLFEALGYLHGRGLVHRDVKPANLLLGQNRTGGLHGKLGDFGIMKGVQDLSSGLTGDGEIGGTPLYLAPEQLLDFKWVGRSADIYGGAATIYYLLTGETPLVLPGDSLPANLVALTAALRDERIPVARRRPDVPPPVAEWLDQALARDPATRERMNAAELGAWLRSAVDFDWSRNQ